jgi:hypothetical protein
MTKTIADCGFRIGDFKQTRFAICNPKSTMRAWVKSAIRNPGVPGTPRFACRGGSPQSAIGVGHD